MPYLLNNQPDKTPITLFNPDREPFIFSYNGGREVYTLYAMSYDEFPKYIALKMASKLAEKMIGKLGVKENFELDKKKLLERIFYK